MVARRKWVQGQPEEMMYSLFPGYVFLFSDAQMEAAALQQIEGVIRVLRYADGSYALHQEDERIARWLLHYDGVIRTSKAIREGDRIHVVEGPMKDCGGTIVKANKQRQRALVEFQFDRRVWSAWMDFSWVEVDEDGMRLFGG
ncbi:hypothetical protein LJC74_07620 [Eubacteriales bacterium OttesenSCG-928-A19]|nr:hypothetical protein [Eubacteriales bacterium OttesenSCG-928-A19]